MSLHDFMVHRAEPRCEVKLTKRPFPLSWVRVLESTDELHDAVAHAIEFERDVVARTSARVSYYEELEGLGELLPLRFDAALADPAPEPHSEAV